MFRSENESPPVETPSHRPARSQPARVEATLNPNANRSSQDVPRAIHRHHHGTDFEWSSLSRPGNLHYKAKMTRRKWTRLRRQRPELFAEVAPCAWEILSAHDLNIIRRYSRAETIACLTAHLLLVSDHTTPLRSLTFPARQNLQLQPPNRPF